MFLQYKEMPFNQLTVQYIHALSHSSDHSNSLKVRALYGGPVNAIMLLWPGLIENASCIINGKLPEGETLR